MISSDGTATADTDLTKANPALLDRLEQIAIVLLWSWFAWRVIHSENPFAPLALVSETAVLVFVLIRRPTAAISLSLGDWMLAFTATMAPLLIAPGPEPLKALVPIALALVFVGNCGQAWAKLVLRRSFGVAPANRGIKISGPYRYVRHPMYAGYLMVHIGLILLLPSLLNLTIYAIGWWAQILRLQAEERLLGEDEAYVAYTKQIRWRLVPGVF
jgi:protein-S-isoprenylcysteine O-methyltransferase Ste14